MGGVGVCRQREAIGDGLETEVGEARKGIGALRFEEAAVVVVGVDEGNVEASLMEEEGEFEHGVNVALGWKWDAYCMWLLW